MTRETQQSITQWADETFGTGTTNIRKAARANEEMAELLKTLAVSDISPKASLEIADVIIVLYRLASYLGVDIHTVIDEKMAINRKREWRKDGTGHGYHVRGDVKAGEP